MRLPATHHALCAQQVCLRSTLYQAVGQRACRRNHQAKEAGPLVDDRSSVVPGMQIRNGICYAHFTPMVRLENPQLRAEYDNRPEAAHPAMLRRKCLKERQQ